MSTQLLLIDLSSIATALFHASGTEPDPDWTAKRTVARVHALASGMSSGVAVATDCPPYFRKDIDPTYKANRTTDHVAVVSHQIKIAIDALKADGFPVWGVRGYEADDIIATATARIMTTRGDGYDESTTLIASADKDLLQLVSDRVSIKSLKDGSIIGPDETRTKFGVWPHQMVDYLSLVGDTSDNVQGAKGIGAKRAAELLELFGNLDDCLKVLEKGETDLVKGSMFKSIVEFKPRLDTVRNLIRLRTDAPIPFDEIFRERVPVATDGSMAFASDTEETMTDEPEPRARAQKPADTQKAVPTDHAVEADHAPSVVRRDEVEGEDRHQHGRPEHAVSGSAGEIQRDRPNGKDPQVSQALVKREPDQLAPLPDDWKHQLEPRSVRQLKDMSLDIAASKHYSHLGSASGVLATIAAGRELGIHMMASLRAFHVIEGKPAMSADLIRALVLQSPLCEYFRIVERNAISATWVTKRRGDPEVSLTYTIEQGRQAWQKDDKAWNASAWGKRPANMVTKTASSELARLVYPDVVMNLYSVEELGGEET